MSTPTKRVTLILFLIATLVSFCGFFELQRATQAILKSWPGVDLDYSGQRRDLFIALAFLAGSISLCSRKATKILFCILALPWILVVLLSVVFLVRGFGSMDFRDAIFILNFVVFAVALWSVFKSKLNLIPLFSFCFVSGQLLLPHFLAARQRTMFEDLAPWSFSRESWWHLAILGLSGLLFLWTIRALYEEWRSRHSPSPTAEVLRSSFRAGLPFYFVNLTWIALVGYISASLHVFGLTPTQVRLDPQLQFHETLLATIPIVRWYSTIRREERRIAPQSTVWFSPNGHSAAFLKRHVTVTGVKWAVVHATSEDPAFDEIGELAFNSTGSHFAYAARDGRDWFVFQDGRKGSSFAAITGLRWIRQGTEITYQGRTGQGWDIVSFVVGDRVWPPGVSYQTFVDDNGALGTVQTKDEVASALLDGTIVFQCQKGARLLTWWWQKEFACVESRNHKQVVIFHGKAGPAVDQIVYPDGPVISADGKQVAYRAEDDGKEFVVVGEQIVPFKSCSDPAFGAGSRVGYLGCGPQGSFLVVDGKPWPSFQNGSTPYFSPDGRFVAYSAGEHDRSFFVVNGKKGPAFDSVNYKPEFAQKNGNYAYIAWRGTHAFVVVGDQLGPEFDSVGDPVFSPDGTNVAYRARRGLKQFIVANGKQGTGFDWVSTPVFSPDGRKVAYTAADGRELWLKVLDVPQHF
jgi:hypothetical protein